MRIFAFPFHGPAYTEALNAELRAQGAQVLRGDWEDGLILKNLRPGDAVHFHWPSYLYKQEGTPIRIARSFFKFVLRLILVRSKTKEIWWTAHNLLPHERCAIPLLDVLARHLIIRMSSRVFIHGAEAEKVLLERFPAARRKCVRIPHGHWMDLYGPVEAREQARTVLKLPRDAFIYLFFGQCRPYKNLDGLIEVFRRETGAEDFLLVAGNFSDDAYLKAIIELAAGDPRIRIDARFIDDSEIPTYFSAANAMCVPYREILTSGTAMLAFGFGTPVLSIDRGFLRDVVKPDTGILVEPDNAQALAEGLRLLRRGQWSSESIIRHAGRFTFRDAAQTTLNCHPASRRHGVLRAEPHQGESAPLR